MKPIQGRIEVQKPKISHDKDTGKVFKRASLISQVLIIMIEVKHLSLIDIDQLRSVPEQLSKTKSKHS